MDRVVAMAFGAGMLASLGSGAAAGTRPERQAPDTVFRSQTELVSVTATVTDRQGRPVANLRKEDFAITEDDAPQEITFFSHDTDTPISIALLVDVSGSMIDKIDDVEDALRHVVSAAREEDEIALVEFSTSIDVVVPFRASRDRLMRAFGTLTAAGGTALYDATIEGLAQLDQGTHRKKVLLLITDGNDTDSRASRNDAVKAATRSEALVYALGIGHGERGSFGHEVFSFQDSVDVRTLRALVEPAGGRAEVIQEAHRRGVDLIDRTLAEFGTELRQQYSLGYYPSHASPEDRTHRVKVTMKSGDYLVRSRTGYRRDASPSRRP